MKFRLLAVAMALMGTVAFGQVSRSPRMPGAFGFRTGKVVTGAPYTANVANTTTRTLADGNTIQRTTTGTVARDSRGRTSSTETIGGMFGQAGTRTVTFISDPVAGYVYALNPETKTAVRRPLHTRQISDNQDAWAERRNALRSAVPNVVSEDKGMQMVNGVNAEGKVVTHTIPAGEMGNQKPIISKTETWFSPDLMVVVASTRTDPRIGDSTYALTNIQRIEPAVTLFQIPSDYTIRDAHPFATDGAKFHVGQ